MYSLYSIIGKNGKIYIGQTGQDPPEKRWSSHRSLAKDEKRNYYFINAIRKHGKDFFTFQVIGKVKTKEEADLAERLYILLFASYDGRYGYNTTFGGEGVRSTEVVKNKIRNPNYDKNVTDEQIVTEYLTCQNYSEVARRLKISYSRARQGVYAATPKEDIPIRKYPSGKQHYAYREVPIEDIINTYQECKSFCETARRLGLGEQLVRDRYYESGQTKLLNAYEGFGENRASFKHEISTDKIVELYEKLKSYAAVAREMSINPGLVRLRYLSYLRQKESA